LIHWYIAKGNVFDRLSSLTYYIKMGYRIVTYTTIQSDKIHYSNYIIDLFIKSVT